MLRTLALPEPEASARRDGYARRKPEVGALHQIVRKNLFTLYAAVEFGQQRFRGARQLWTYGGLGS